MVLSTTKRTASIQSIVNRSQGGGEKKAGFPYMVGRGSWSNIALGADGIPKGNCCKLADTQVMRFPLAHQSRPIGGRSVNLSYWHIPGTGR